MFGFEENDLQEVANPEERRYWKNNLRSYR